MDTFSQSFPSDLVAEMHPTPETLRFNQPDQEFAASQKGPGPRCQAGQCAEVLQKKSAGRALDLG